MVSRRLGILVLLLSATVVCGQTKDQTVYYATYEDGHFSKPTWHISSLSEFNAAGADAYDSYTVERRRDGKVVVHRDYATPSGDWRFELTYYYGRDRRLYKIHSEFITFGGISMPDAGGGLTRCSRTFSVSPKGELRKTSERITDEKAGKEVVRSSFSPQVAHWMTLDQLPIQPKANPPDGS